MGLVAVALAVGASACGNDGTRGRQQADLDEVESQVAQLRLEVQNLRRELDSLRDDVESSTTTSVPPGATSPTTTTR
ncbi:MAG: hypothetical protein AMXMBFR46_13790 [Acidimicrobiia bacterium]